MDPRFWLAAVEKEFQREVGNLSQGTIGAAPIHRWYCRGMTARAAARRIIRRLIHRNRTTQAQTARPSTAAF